MLTKNHNKKRREQYAHNVVYIAMGFDTSQLYIGVKSFNEWKTFYKYKTSSKYFKDEPKMKHVVADFSTREEAKGAETELQQILEVNTCDVFANRCISTSTGFDLTGIRLTDEQIRLRKNKTVSTLTKEKICLGRGCKRIHWIYEDGTKEHAFIFEMVDKYGLNACNLSQVSLKRQVYHKGWRLDPDFYDVSNIQNRSIDNKVSRKDGIKKSTPGRKKITVYWRHSDGTTEYLSSTDLAKKYGLNYSQLSKVKTGLIRQHKGWMLDPKHYPIKGREKTKEKVGIKSRKNPKKKARKSKVYVWVSPDGTEEKWSVPQLIKRYPEKELKKNGLYKVARGAIRVYKGWELAEKENY